MFVKIFQVSADEEIRKEKGNLSSFRLKRLFQIRACEISELRAKRLDATTMFNICSHENTPLGQSERAYYLSYFIN